MEERRSYELNKHCVKHWVVNLMPGSILVKMEWVCLFKIDKTMILKWKI